MILQEVLVAQLRARESWAGTTNVYMGDSITYGDTVTALQRWPYLLSLGRGGTADNRGEPGAGVTPPIGTLGCGRGVIDAGDAPAKSGTHKYIFLAPGVNDIGCNVPAITVSAYTAAYQQMINDLIAKGWSTSDMVIVTPFYITGYSLYVGTCTVTVAADVARHEAFVAAAIGLAHSNHTILIDIYTAMRDSEDPASLLSDTVHPNALGHQFITDYMDSCVDRNPL